MIGKFIFILVCFALAMPVFPASTSSSYKLTAGIVSIGGAKGVSSSYQLSGAARELAVGVPTGASFKIGEGFFKTLPGIAVILSPIIVSVEAGTVTDNTTLALTVYGANFSDGATVKLSLDGQSDLAATNVVVVNSGKITCELNIGSAIGGSWNITVTNADGRSGSLPAAVNLYNAPSITSIVPTKAFNDASGVVMVINGANFREGASVLLQLAGEIDISGTSASVSGTERITVNFSLESKAPGHWDVKVTNPDGKTGVLAGAFVIEEPALQIKDPLIISIQPNPEAPTVMTTNMQYKLSQDAEIIIYIYNIRGERVWTYIAPAGTEGGQAGLNQVIWDGLTAFKTIAGSGVYFIHVTSKVDGQVRVLRKEKIGIVR